MFKRLKIGVNKKEKVEKNKNKKKKVEEKVEDVMIYEDDEIIDYRDKKVCGIRCWIWNLINSKKVEWDERWLTSGVMDQSGSYYPTWFKSVHGRYPGGYGPCGTPPTRPSSEEEEEEDDNDVVIE